MHDDIDARCGGAHGVGIPEISKPDLDALGITRLGITERAKQSADGVTVGDQTANHLATEVATGPSHQHAPWAADLELMRGARRQIGMYSDFAGLSHENLLGAAHRER